MCLFAVIILPLARIVRVDGCRWVVAGKFPVSCLAKVSRGRCIKECLLKGLIFNVFIVLAVLLLFIVVRGQPEPVQSMFFHLWLFRGASLGIGEDTLQGFRLIMPVLVCTIGLWLFAISSSAFSEGNWH
jgi:hypothetical protein